MSPRQIALWKQSRMDSLDGRMFRSVVVDNEVDQLLLEDTKLLVRAP